MASTSTSKGSKTASNGRDVTSELIYLTKALKAPALRDAAGCGWPTAAGLAELGGRAGRFRAVLLGELAEALSRCWVC
ncbi:hypothetical protein ABT124_17445 [Streptomyces sp. NPDC001982]|uniref:hypothetical protein n=1 Tax=unclassified Streptomyces TaxID=2593676 RepID=UPI0033328C81